MVDGQDPIVDNGAEVAAEEERRRRQAEAQRRAEQTQMQSRGTDRWTIQMGEGDNANFYDIFNPGRADLSIENPELWAEIQHLRGARSLFDYEQYLDPSRLMLRRQDAIDRNMVALNNQYARMGLAGSAAALGAADESARQTNFAFDDRQLSESLRALQMEQMLTGNIEKSILAGQGQFGAFQQQYLSTVLGLQNAEAQAQAADNAMWGNIISAIGTVGGAVAGAAIGGPAGAVAGAGLGSGLGKAYGAGSAGQFGYDGSGASPATYNSPSFGTIDGSGYADGYFN